MYEQDTIDPERSEQLRVAVLGYGLAGSVFHAPLIAGTSGMEVAAIVTNNDERRRRAQRDYPLAAVLDNAEDVFRTADLFDLVVVATPNRFHAPLAQASMRAGIPVVIDKPMATSVAHANELITTSAETEVPLTCFQNRRWDGDFLTVRQIVEGDVLGRITRFESRFERYRPQVRESAWREYTSFEEGGGLLWDLGSHLIDQALVLFGRPTHVYAEMASRRPRTDLDDDVFVALSFDGGEVAHLWMSVMSRVSGPRFRLQGFRGTFEKFGFDPQEAELRAGKRPSGGPWGVEPESAWGRQLTDVGGVTVDGTVHTLPGAYPDFYASMRDSLVHNTPVPVAPRDVLRTLQIIEAARESARHAITVKLDRSVE